MKNTPIVIHQHLIQKFMTLDKDFSNALALYTFYIYHAQKQQTNQPLATDSFTGHGLSWGIEKVKRVKRILKDLKVIEVVQKRRYSYIHLFFIYTKKKLGELFGENTQPIKEVKEEIKVPQPIQKTAFHLELEKHYLSQSKINAIRKEILMVKNIEKYKFAPITFAKWIAYCEKYNISYNKSHALNWIKKLDKRTTIEQKEAIYQAINKKWKDFYFSPIKESPYHSFLGKSLYMEEKNCDILLDIDIKNGVYLYQFKNTTLKTKETPKNLFLKYGYDKEERSKAPISLKVMSKISGIIKRF